MDHNSWLSRSIYHCSKFVLRMGAVSLFGIRTSGREWFPSEGPTLLCVNHQSFLDPAIMGLVLQRRLGYIARKSLFSIPLFSTLIQSLGGIPIDRDGFSLEGIKETLRRLRRGEAVLIFPEGTRSKDGALQPLRPGFRALARRGKAQLVAAGIAGAFQAWPRTQKLPGLARLGVSLAKPITPEKIEQLSDEDLVAMLETQMRDQLETAERLTRPE